MRDRGADSPRNLKIDKAGSGPVLLSRWSIGHGQSSNAVSNANAFPVQAINTYLPMLRDVPSRNAFREKLAGIFVDYQLPLEVVESTPQAARRGNWLLLVLELPAFTPALENSLLALCTARLGRYHENPVLIQESLSLYTRSLRDLQRAVRNPATRCDEQNIAACMALTTYEILECPGKTLEGYTSHYNGAMKLLQLRGAAAHTSGLAHSVFQSLRRHSVSSPTATGQTLELEVNC
jgi:Fungal specific transcription factor domain